MKISDKVTLLAELEILPGFESIVTDAATEIWIATRKEAGCKTFLFSKKKEAFVIVFFEAFTSDTAFEIHKEAAHTKNFLGFLKGKVKNDAPSLTFLDQFEDEYLK